MKAEEPEEPDRAPGPLWPEVPEREEPDRLLVRTAEMRSSKESLYLLTASVATRLTGPSFHMRPLAPKQRWWFLKRDF